MPVYNSEKYVSKAIESVLAQDFEDFELILVNDGSTDNSAEICDQFAEKYEKSELFIKKMVVFALLVMPDWTRLRENI